eukprot:TRINITY_DN20893_c0_g1_i1.p1 TRINITY_DN20893_c0_g1~~TRINITY_DN20893_c0_g1_i1.p1  ORF type:complete len:182 (+),score=34.55 TRINITY_DN20893_c0_g1_i1:50-547(+)
MEGGRDAPLQGPGGPLQGADAPPSPAARVQRSAPPGASAGEKPVVSGAAPSPPRRQSSASERRRAGVDKVERWIAELQKQTTFDPVPEPEIREVPTAERFMPGGWASGRCGLKRGRSEDPAVVKHAGAEQRLARLRQRLAKLEQRREQRLEQMRDSKRRCVAPVP